MLASNIGWMAIGVTVLIINLLIGAFIAGRVHRFSNNFGHRFNRTWSFFRWEINTLEVVEKLADAAVVLWMPLIVVLLGAAVVALLVSGISIAYAFVIWVIGEVSDALRGLIFWLGETFQRLYLGQALIRTQKAEETAQSNGQPEESVSQTGQKLEFGGEYE